MTEQERPRTEAEPTTWMGRSLLRADRRAFTDAVLRSFVLAIEEAARTEGRQQAVREISDLASDEIEKGTHALDAFQRAMRKVATDG